MFFIVLPIYNEEKEIGRLFRRIDKFMKNSNFTYKIIAVNDGSTDRSVEVIREHMEEVPLELINFEHNTGVGAAFKAGLQRALELADNEDIIVTMDADNTHDPRIIKMMKSRIDEGYEVVIASVFHKGGMLIGVPLTRLVFTIGANFLYRIFFHIKGIREYTGFYKGYNAEALRKTFEKFGDEIIESKGFAVMAELLIKFRRMPLFITEVPLIMRYDLKGERTKLKTIPTISEHLKVILKNVFKSRIA